MILVASVILDRVALPNVDQLRGRRLAPRDDRIAENWRVAARGNVR